MEKLVTLKSLIVTKAAAAEKGTFPPMSNSQVKQVRMQRSSEARDALVTPLLRMTLHKAAVEGTKRTCKEHQTFASPKYLQDYSKERYQARYSAKSAQMLYVSTQRLDHSSSSSTEEE